MKGIPQIDIREIAGYDEKQEFWRKRSEFADHIHAVAVRQFNVDDEHISWRGSEELDRFLSCWSLANNVTMVRERR